MIGIIDYGAGNIRSVINAFEFVGTSAKLVKAGENLNLYDKLVLPGVGAFGDAMDKLRVNDLNLAIIDFIKAKKPFLGICLVCNFFLKKDLSLGSIAD